MEKFIAECKTIWTEEQNQRALNLIQNGLSRSKLSDGDYHIIREYDVANIGGVYKVRNKKKLAFIWLLNKKLQS